MNTWIIIEQAQDSRHHLYEVNSAHPADLETYLPHDDADYSPEFNYGTFRQLLSSHSTLSTCWISKKVHWGCRMIAMSGSSSGFTSSNCWKHFPSSLTWLCSLQMSKLASDYFAERMNGNLSVGENIMLSNQNNAFFALFRSNGRSTSSNASWTRQCRWRCCTTCSFSKLKPLTLSITCSHPSSSRNP